MQGPWLSSCPEKPAGFDVQVPSGPGGGEGQLGVEISPASPSPGIDCGERPADRRDKAETVVSNWQSRSLEKRQVKGY